MTFDVNSCPWKEGKFNIKEIIRFWREYNLSETGGAKDGTVPSKTEKCTCFFDYLIENKKYRHIASSFGQNCGKACRILSCAGLSEEERKKLKPFYDSLKG